MKKILLLLLMAIALFVISIIVFNNLYMKNYNSRTLITRSSAISLPVQRIIVDHGVIFINETHVISNQAYGIYKLDDLRQATKVEKNAESDTLHFLSDGDSKAFVVFK